MVGDDVHPDLRCVEPDEPVQAGAVGLAVVGKGDVAAPVATQQRHERRGLDGVVWDDAHVRAHAGRVVLVGLAALGARAAAREAGIGV